MPLPKFHSTSFEGFVVRVFSNTAKVQECKGGIWVHVPEQTFTDMANAVRADLSVNPAEFVRNHSLINFIR